VEHPDTLTVVLSEPVELAHAPNPTNDSERLLFRQLLDPLIRIDCKGRIRPSVAQSWSADSEGRTWTFTLRKGAALPRGTPIDAPQVASLLAGPDGKTAGIDSAVALDDRRVRVHLSQPSHTAPTVLAEPELAMLEDGLTSGAAAMRGFDIPRRDGRPFIQFQVARHGDPRDAIDRGVDLAVTRDPAVVEYVAGRPDILTYPLPWSRTYILLQPTGAQPIGGVSGVDSLRRSLARDAVPAEARPAELPFWTDRLSTCAALAHAERREGSSSRVVYPRGDEVARGLAERIVALSGDAQFKAAPLAPADFAAALGREAERAYVVPTPRHTLSPCRESAGWPVPAFIQPLIDTRATAIVRRGASPLSVDWDGTIRVEDSRGLP
jgi:extracellular solute-binding protein (family 5)